MEIILLERIERLGKIGDTVKVKTGYARNFLLPRGKALRANKENLEQFEAQRGELEQKNTEALAAAKVVLEKINDQTFTLIRQASERGQLYGSVNSRDIVAQLAAEGCDISPSQVMLNHVIKMLGVHAVHIRLHPEAIAEIQLNVARTEEDAAGQLVALTSEEQAESLTKAAAELFEEGAAPEIPAEETQSDSPNKENISVDNADQAETIIPE